GAAGPLELLPGEGVEVGGDEAGGMERGNEDRAPPTRVEAKRSVKVLGESGLVPPDAPQGRASERTETAPDGSRPAAVHPHRGRAVHVVGLTRCRPGNDRFVVVVKGEAALHEADRGIPKIAEHGVQEVGRGDVVDIEDRDELAGGAGERGIDVTRLRMSVPEARQVASAQAPG